MKLRYVNQDAEEQHVQVPSVQTEPLAFGEVYDVDDALGAILVKTPHWEAVQDRTAKPVGKNARKKE